MVRGKTFKQTFGRWQIATTAAFILLVVAFVTSSVLVYRSQIEGTAIHEKYVRQTTAMEAVDSVMQELVDAETGQRGFLLTGDDAYLVPYKAADGLLQRSLGELSEAVRLDDRLTEPATRLRDLAYDKMGELRRTIRLAQTTSFQAAIDQVKIGAGARMMKDIREVALTFHRTVEQDRDDTAQARSQFIERSKFNLTLSTVGVVVFLLVAYILILRTLDSSERKRLDRERYAEELEAAVTERTTELRNAVAELEGFTYSVSHDMRTPLRWIVGSSQILIDDHSAELTEEAKDLLQRQAAAGHRLSALIDDLLAYARLSRKQVERSVVDVVPMVNRLLAELPGAKLNSPPELTVLADPELVGIVISNLVENSIKYREKSRPLEISLSERSTEFGKALVFGDNGIGFDQAYVKKIFLPFERLHRDSEYPGTGIGLANVERVIKRHGGRIWAEGKPGEGATFFFTFAPPPA